MPRRPIGKEIAIRDRNRKNAQTSTGPRVAAGERRSTMNALTHGLRAETPRDDADVADRKPPAMLFVSIGAPVDEFETAFLHRMVGAFHGLGKVDAFERQALDAAVLLRETTRGGILTNQERVQMGFTAINRDRATARQDLFKAYRLLEVHRHKWGVKPSPVLPNEPRS